MRPALALDLAGLVHPLVAREPVVRHQRRIPRAEISIAEWRLLPAHAVVSIPVALAAPLAERDDVQLGHLPTPEGLRVERSQRELRVGLPLLGPRLGVPARCFALKVGEPLSGASPREQVGANHQRLARATTPHVLLGIERRAPQAHSRKWSRSCSTAIAWYVW